MRETLESHIPLSLREWLDEKIARETSAFTRPVFHGLRCALAEKSPEEEISEAVSLSRNALRN